MRCLNDLRSSNLVAPMPDLAPYGFVKEPLFLGAEYHPNLDLRRLFYTQSIGKWDLRVQYSMLHETLLSYNPIFSIVHNSNPYGDMTVNLE